MIMNVMPLGAISPDQTKPPKGDTGSHSGVTISSNVSPQPKSIKIRGDAKALKAVSISFDKNSTYSILRFLTAAQPLFQVSYRMMQYPLVYMFIWIIPTALRIYHATAGKQGPLSLIVIDKVYFFRGLQIIALHLTSIFIRVVL